MLIALVVLALFYGGRLLGLSIMAAEGDVPSASAVPLPMGAEILNETSDCASSGCWSIVTVRPSAGQTPAALAEEIGATP